MTKKHSTGALSDEAKAQQDQRYTEGHQYDYVIIGTGSAALTAGALLANAGYKICMLEAHDIPGGYMHSFQMGDYFFCAQVHYIWGCGPGGKIYEFLKHIGLEKDITFELMNQEGYDHMVMPDGKHVKIPYGFDQLAENIEVAYPGQREAVKKFTNVIEKIRTELREVPDHKIEWWKYLTKVHKVPTLIRYLKKTVQDVFDECGLGKEAQAVLIAQAGDFMLPPEKLSIFMYAGLFGGYNTGAYYPTKHFKYYVDRLAEFITSHEGCHIYYETEVTKINETEGEVTGIQTKDGKIFEAQKYICNMDPQKASHLMNREKFSAKEKKQLEYEYSVSGIMMYLGIEGIDLRDYGFGSHNFWHMEQWDMNKIWNDQAAGNFEKPWLFMSTPSLHSDEPGTTPEGGQILEIATYAEYDLFEEAQKQGYKDYGILKNKIAERLLDLVEEKYVPNLREHIKIKVVGSSITNEDFCMAPHGNAYGSTMVPENVGLGRLKSTTPWHNFFWCNASSGWPGVYGTVGTGMQLYMDFTGDRFYDSATAPTDQELIARLPLHEHEPAAAS